MPISETFGLDQIECGAEYVSKRAEDHGLNPELVNELLRIGSVLGGFTAQHMNGEKVGDPSGPVAIALNELFQEMGLPEMTEKVPGHANRLLIGPLDGDSSGNLVMAEDGCEHPFQGVSTARATIPVRIAQLFGTESWYGSNAAGIITPGTLDEGDIMAAFDDLGQNDSPLIGPHDPALGLRFPYMSDVYPQETMELFRKVAERLGIELKEGVYARMMGPTYERRAQVYALRDLLERIWAQAAKQPGEWAYKNEPTGTVGMSSVYESETAMDASLSPNRAFHKHRGLLSLATNYSSALGPRGFVVPSNHDEVTRAAEAAEERMGGFVKEVIF